MTCCATCDRFDGFDAALESASADIACGEEVLRAATRANNEGAFQRSSLAKQGQQFRSSVRGFQKLMSDTLSAGRRRIANGALSPERAVSPPPQSRGEQLGHSRTSSPLPNSPGSEVEDGGVLSDGALQRRNRSR